MRYGTCPVCRENLDKSVRPYFNQTLAIYIRITGRRFVRIGTLYTKCRHTVYDFTGVKLPT